MDIRTLTSILINLYQLRQHERWTREQVLKHQRQSFEKLRRYVYRYSPFYRNFHRGLETAPLHDLPILTKQILMENFDEIVTEPSIHLDDLRRHIKSDEAHEAYQNRYWVNATSGSSGYPGIFLFNRSEWARVIASYARGQEWSGLKLDLLRQRKIAIIASTTPYHMSTMVGQSAKTPWVSTLQLAASEPIEKIVQALNEWQPEIVIAYASMARLLAEEQAQGRLSISPKAIFTSSEVLTEESRRRIERAWGSILFNEYAATDGGGLAAECTQHHGLHLFEDLTIFEIVDENYQAVPAGTYGEKLLITVLFKYVQPLIRYELTDSLRLVTETCPLLPFSLIDSIQGRQEDTLYLPDRNGQLSAIHPNIFHDIMDTLTATAWQVVQTDIGLRVLLQGLEETISDKAVEERLSNALAKQDIRSLPISVERVIGIPKGANGKAPLIKANNSSK